MFSYVSVWGHKCVCTGEGTWVPNSWYKIDIKLNYSLKYPMVEFSEPPLTFEMWCRIVISPNIDSNIIVFIFDIIFFITLSFSSSF